MTGRTISILILVIVSTTVCVGAVYSSTSLSSIEERAFCADDRDISSAAVEDPNQPQNYVKITDIPYFTTKPDYEINGTTLFEYQRQSLDRMDTPRNESLVLPMSTVRDSDLIKDAHVTFLGIHGGAASLFQSSGSLSGQRDSNPVLIGSKGSVLSHADYRIDDSIPPDTWCGPKRNTTTQLDIDGDSKNETLLVDGDQTCFRYSVDTAIERSVSMGGETFSGGDVIEYSDLTAETIDTLEVRAEITVTVNQIFVDREWAITTWPAFDWNDGEWGNATYAPTVHEQDRLTVASDPQQYLVTDTGSLDIHQTVVDVDENTNHIILSLEGPRGSEHVDANDLRDRLLWSSLNLGSTIFVDGTWRTYSRRQFDTASVYRTGGGRQTITDPPQVPRAFLIGMDRRPTVATQSQPSTTAARVSGFSGYNVSVSQRNHSHVTLDPKTPIEYNRIVLSNAPQNVTSLTTIHGRHINVDVDETIHYRQPDVTIQQTATENQVRIHVEDPKTNEPLTGRAVRLYGVEPRSTVDGVAMTDSSGDVYGQRTNVLVRARVARDDWADPTGSAFYDRAVASRTFLPTVLLVKRARSLLGALLLVSPLIIFYGYLRHFDLLK